MAYTSIPVRTINSTDVVPMINASPQAMTTGTITTSTSTITATDLTGVGSATVSIYGTFAGVNATFEAYDGTNWFAIPAKNASTVLADAATTTGVIATAQYYNVSPLLGVQQLRVRATAYTSGTASVIIEPSTQFVNNLQQVVGAVTVASTTVTSLVPGVAATSLGKAEDAVATTGDTGVAAWGVRRDAAITTSPTSAAGDYSELAVDNYGQLRTAVQARTTNPTAAADGNGIVIMADKLGKQVVVGSIRDLKGDQTTTITSSTTETTILTAQGAGVFADVYMLTLTNTSITATEVVVRDVTAGGTAQSFMVPAGQTVGFTLPESGARKQATANSAWTAQCTTSVASIKAYVAYVRNI